MDGVEQVELSITKFILCIQIVQQCSIGQSMHQMLSMKMRRLLQYYERAG